MARTTIRHDIHVYIMHTIYHHTSITSPVGARPQSIYPQYVHKTIDYHRNANVVHMHTQHSTAYIHATKIRVKEIYLKHS